MIIYKGRRDCHPRTHRLDTSITPRTLTYESNDIFSPPFLYVRLFVPPPFTPSPMDASISICALFYQVFVTHTLHFLSRSSIQSLRLSLSVFLTYSRWCLDLRSVLYTTQYASLGGCMGSH